MNSIFRYRGNEFYAEDVPLSKIADKIGTPFYAYSQAQILANIAAFQRAFKTIPHHLCYALKANSNLTILKLIASTGCGADIVSGGELFLARKAGFSADKIVFAGVGKTDSEIEAALKAAVFMLNVESIEELYVIQNIARKLNRVVRIAVRVNPDVDALTHPYISTGQKTHKFGLPLEAAPECYRIAARLSHIRVAGIHMHLGSQILNVEPYREAMVKVIDLVDRLSSEGIQIRYLDMGGGLGIDSRNNRKLAPQKIANIVRPLLKGKDLMITLEPGRSIIADAGILVARVLYTKRYRDKKFIVVDAAMNDLIRPALYDAYHPIVPLHKNARKKITADIVGPVCETGDFLARDRMVTQMQSGELLSILNTGAYGFSMSSQYNSRLRAPEVMISGDRYQVIRQRESLRDLMRNQ